MAVDRRSFLAAAGAGALLAGLPGCGNPVRTSANRQYLALTPTQKPGRASLGFFRERGMTWAARGLMAEVSDFSWLKKGDSVFVKLACNSPHPHPAVTCPDSVVAMVAALRDMGAGRVLVGDQAGAEHVRLHREGRINATRHAMARNGLLAAVRKSGAELHCFDDQGWEGYSRATPRVQNHWGNSLYLAKILDEVDHVVLLPRLSTHAVAGYTCATKAAVGWLRDDSRLELHQKGGTFFEKIAEINTTPQLADKLRLVLTLGTAAMLGIGPDFGAEYDVTGCFGLASTSLVDHDLACTALLPWLEQKDVSFYDIYTPYPENVNFWNRNFVKQTWGPAAAKAYEPILPPHLNRGPEYDIALSHLAVLQRYRPTKVDLALQGTAFPRGLIQHLKQHADGIFNV